jgi:hypothetical protein
VPYDLAKLKEKWTAPSVDRARGPDVSQSGDDSAANQTWRDELAADISMQSGNLKAAALNLMPQIERSMVEGSCNRWSDGSFYQDGQVRESASVTPGADEDANEQLSLRELEEKAYRLKSSVREAVGAHHSDAASRVNSTWSAHFSDQHVHAESSFPPQLSGDDDRIARKIESLLREFAGLSGVWVKPESVAPKYSVLVRIEGGSVNAQILSVRASRAALAYDSPARTVLEASIDPAFRTYITDCVTSVNQELLALGFEACIDTFTISGVPSDPAVAASQGYRYLSLSRAR